MSLGRDLTTSDVGKLFSVKNPAETGIRCVRIDAIRPEVDKNHAVSVTVFRTFGQAVASDRTIDGRCILKGSTSNLFDLAGEYKNPPFEMTKLGVYADVNDKIWVALSKEKDYYVLVAMKPTAENYRFHMCQKDGQIDLLNTKISHYIGPLE